MKKNWSIKCSLVEHKRHLRIKQSYRPNIILTVVYVTDFSQRSKNKDIHRKHSYMI